MKRPILVAVLALATATSPGLNAIAASKPSKFAFGVSGLRGKFVLHSEKDVFSHGIVHIANGPFVPTDMRYCQLRYHGYKEIELNSRPAKKVCGYAFITTNNTDESCPKYFLFEPTTNSFGEDRLNGYSYRDNKWSIVEQMIPYELASCMKKIKVPATETEPTSDDGVFADPPVPVTSKSDDDERGGY